MLVRGIPKRFFLRGVPERFYRDVLLEKSYVLWRGRFKSIILAMHLRLVNDYAFLPVRTVHQSYSDSLILYLIGLRKEWVCLTI